MADSPESVLLDEARRALTSQEANLGALQVKATAVLSAAAVVAGLLGASLPTKRFGGLAIAAVVTFALTGVLTVVILWPITVQFVGDLDPLLEHVGTELAEFDDEQRPLSGEQRQRATRQYEVTMAASLNDFRKGNRTTMKVKTWVFTVACGLLAVQVVLWAAALATV
jgi:hypothetical protein